MVGYTFFICLFVLRFNVPVKKYISHVGMEPWSATSWVLTSALGN